MVPRPRDDAWSICKSDLFGFTGLAVALASRSVGMSGLGSWTEPAIKFGRISDLFETAQAGGPNEFTISRKLDG